MRRNLSEFVGTNLNFSRTVRLVLWTTLQSLQSNRLVTNRLRIAILRVSGAKIGMNAVLRCKIRIHFPWNLEIGDDCWIGEEVWFISHEKIKIGSNVCISQRSIICSGGHNYRSASLDFAHKPIEIKDGAWVCLDAKVLPGVTIGECSVVSAGEIARKSVPDYSMLVGGEIRTIDPPK